ncbi:MAG: pyridoxal 5'-phosphate synthase glutaminase subunit PdxT [Polyangiaceae bacterium]
MKRIAVLALQGGFEPHAAMLDQLGHDVFEARTAADIERADGLVLPGGESSVQLLLIGRFGLEPAIRAVVTSGRPILATCAGAILSAANVASPEQRSFGFVDIDVVRNAYGRQRDSFEATSDAGRNAKDGRGAGTFDGLPLVFIRAPRIVRVGPSVEILAAFSGEPILVRQGNVTAATFHPELTADGRVHRDVFGGHRAAKPCDAGGVVPCPSNISMS